MNQVSNVDYKSFDKYFTTDEFDFIHISKFKVQKLDDLLQKEYVSKDFIIALLDKINNFSTTSQSDLSNTPVQQLLSDIQENLANVNSNIENINRLKCTYSDISNKFVDLIIKIEANIKPFESYKDEIQNIKNIINDFQIQYKDTYSSIILNSIRVHTFLVEEIEKKCDGITLSDLNIAQEIKSAEVVEENPMLFISEKYNKVYLPYSKREVQSYLEQYPDDYQSFSDVVIKEFIFPLNFYTKHPVTARFREAYSLIRDREAKSIIDSFKFALNIMFRYDLSPAIVAACKTQEQLEKYIECLDNKTSDKFEDFQIKFEITPLEI